MSHVGVAVVMLGVCVPCMAKLVTRPVEYRQGETVLEGYLAYDDAVRERRPGVLVVHEWYGLNDYAKKRAEQVAGLGYVAFAVDMYGKGVVTDDPKRAGELAGQVRGKPVLRERIVAALETLKRQERVDPQRIAAMGYCFGGTTALQLAYTGADVAGVVSFHGSLTPPQEEDMRRIKAKVLVLHGADDPMVPPEMVNAFEKAMREAKADWQLIAYGGAVHSFTNPNSGRAGIEGVGYNEKADRRSWEHMKLFFEEIFGKGTK